MAASARGAHGAVGGEAAAAAADGVDYGAELMESAAMVRVLLGSSRRC